MQSREATDPRFGQASLENCEREPIHLAGSVQPHGVLLRALMPSLTLIQASANVVEFLGVSPAQLLGQPLRAVLPALKGLPAEAPAGASETRGEAPSAAPTGSTGWPAADASLPITLTLEGGGRLEGQAHCTGGCLVVELERAPEPAGLSPAALMNRLGHAIQRFSDATTLPLLSQAVVDEVRALTGYDRVMVYKFDADGHGQVIAEARDAALSPLLGHHYPASDIPQRARDLYLRHRVRVLVDVDYQPVPLVPARVSADVQAALPPMPRGFEGEPGDLDMSMCLLRSMSPIHIEYLKNMGVTATLTISLIREGRLWGLVACHHDQPRHLGQALHSAAELMGEAVSTRIAAIENYTRAQVASQVRRLEQRLIEATASEGDWRAALFRQPNSLQAPLEATGLALVHDGEVLTGGEVPPVADLLALSQWIDAEGFGNLFATSSIEREAPELASLTPLAAGVLAVKLSSTEPTYLMWLRKEQVRSVVWAGDPSKPMEASENLPISPRRSFAAWTQIVRGTAQTWTPGDKALARAMGEALVDVIAQVNAVRLLIAEHQLARVRSMVADAREPVVVAGQTGRPFHANAAFRELCGLGQHGFDELQHLMDALHPPPLARQMLGQVRAERRSWRGEMQLRHSQGHHVPVLMRAEPVPSRDGSVMGYIFIVEDMTLRHQDVQARAQLESVLSGLSRTANPEDQPLLEAIVINASLAATDIGDEAGHLPAAPLLREVEQATHRAAALYGRLRLLVDGLEDGSEPSSPLRPDPPRAN